MTASPLRRREYRYPRQIISQWERDIIELGLRAGWTPPQIAKWLRRPEQTIYHRRKMLVKQCYGFDSPA